mgnify:CR=1 FL=1
MLLLAKNIASALVSPDDSRRALKIQQASPGLVLWDRLRVSNATVHSYSIRPGDDSRACGQCNRLLAIASLRRPTDDHHAHGGCGTGRHRGSTSKVGPG